MVRSGVAPGIIQYWAALKSPGAVVLMTRWADERLWLETPDAGACDLLAKPYRPEDLRWVVSTALKRRPAPDVAPNPSLQHTLETPFGTRKELTVFDFRQ